MVDGEIGLQETELLVLQHLLDGENFGMGYDDFEDKNIDYAAFQAPDRGRLYRTEVVNRAREGGRLSELEFRIEVETNDSSPDRQINAVVNREGTFRSRQNGPDELADRFMANLEIVMEYRDKLTTLGVLLDDYVSSKSLMVSATQDQMFDKTSRAFGDLVEDKFTAINHEGRDREVYKSIVANVGIELSKLPLRNDRYPDIDNYDGKNIDYDGQVSDFFEVYATRVEGTERPDFDLLAGHLHHVLRSGDEYDSLPGMLDFVERTYDI